MMVMIMMMVMINQDDHTKVLNIARVLAMALQPYPGWNLRNKNVWLQMILKDHPGWNLINNDNVWLLIDICKMILINN